MNNPLVSVIIPAYNAEAYISEALESVFAQTYRPFEIIVVDDGSTDKTAEIVKNYQTSKTTKTNETNLIYIYQSNSGPSKARNEGMKVAKGDYIAFLDADDLWTPMKLEKQVNYMLSNREVFLVFGDMMIFNEQGVVVESTFKKNGYPECDRRGKVLNAFERLIERNYIPSGTVLLKRDCFEKVGYFDENIRHGEDYDLWLRISLMFHIGCIPEVLRLKRIHGDSLSKDSEGFYKSRIYILNKLNKNYSNLINAKCGRDFKINNYTLKAIRGLSYFYYLKKDYLKALKTFAQYLFVAKSI
jgi:glycosyltransferase involved in cell wall biosynthesis